MLDLYTTTVAFSMIVQVVILLFLIKLYRGHERHGETEPSPSSKGGKVNQKMRLKKEEMMLILTSIGEWIGRMTSSYKSLIIGSFLTTVSNFAFYILFLYHLHEYLIFACALNSLAIFFYIYAAKKR